VYSEEVIIGPCSHRDSQETLLFDTNLQVGKSAYSEEVDIGPCSYKD
jgi:3-deoxy-D-arabino-heptulosonate 7-phosphate (DAHP) synthase